jgi:hypothetical protein
MHANTLNNPFVEQTHLILRLGDDSGITVFLLVCTTG